MQNSPQLLHETAEIEGMKLLAFSPGSSTLALVLVDFLLSAVEFAGHELVQFRVPGVAQGGAE